MGDSCARDVRQSATLGELITCVIEPRLSLRQSLSCDLNQVLSLRGWERSEHENLSSRGTQQVTRCNLCARSDLSPMFPAAR